MIEFLERCVMGLGEKMSSKYIDEIKNMYNEVLQMISLQSEGYISYYHKFTTRIDSKPLSLYFS